MTPSLTFRPARSEDIPSLGEIATRTGKFRESEVEVLLELLRDYFSDLESQGHCCDVLESDEAVVGFAYFAQASMSESAWYLYWLAVDPARQGRGFGRAALGWVESRIRSSNGSQVLIETSSSPQYAATRVFYLACGYALEATLRDYYSRGDSMEVYRKVL